MMASEKDFLIGIVDDHPQTATSISEMLEYNDFNTWQANSGEKAIEMCAEKKPDLLILDIKMEKMNGFEVAEKLPKQKILFMTGFDIEDSKISKFKNVIGKITKPVDIEDLLRVVRKAVGIRSKNK